MNDLISKIQTELPGFSKGQKQIARYILEHYDKAAFMTASRLGVTVGVSESTVVRFATELGYDGYPHLQRALQEMIRNKLTSVQRMEVSSDRLGGRDVLRTVLRALRLGVSRALNEIDRDAIHIADDTRAGADRIYELGVRSSSALANFLGFYFNLLFDNVTLVHTNSVSEIFEQVLRIGPGDVLFGISFPRYSKRTLSAMQYARDRGAKVIALTDSQLSPLARVADHLLLARSDMASFVDSLVAPLSVINALIVAVGMSRRDEIEHTFNKLESIWEKYDVYEKPEDDTN